MVTRPRRPGAVADGLVADGAVAEGDVADGDVADGLVAVGALAGGAGSAHPASTATASTIAAAGVPRNPPRTDYSVKVRSSTSCSPTWRPCGSNRPWSNRLRNSRSTLSGPERFFSTVITTQLW